MALVGILERGKLTIEFIIELIYRAALDDSWQDVVSALSIAAGDIHVHLFGHDATLNKVNVAAQKGYDPSFLETYDSHYHGINSWLPGVMKSPVGQAVYCEEYLKKGELHHTEFYNDWIRPQEEIGTGGGIVLFKDASRFVILGGNIRYKDEDQKVQPWIELLDRLAPHLRDAFDLQRTLQGRLLTNRAYLEVIERMDNAVILLDAKARVQFSNKAAGGILDDQRVCSVDRAGALHFKNSRSNNCFQAGMKTISERKSSAPCFHFALQAAAAKGVMPATLAPFSPDQGATGIWADFAAVRMPIAMLTIGNTAGQKAKSDEALAATFGLTPSEGELVRALCDGETLRDIAERRSRSIHTLRQQLRSTFEKTGTNRQAELVSLLATLRSV